MRSRDALESALGRPESYAHYEVSGYRVTATDRELADWIIGLGRAVIPQATADEIRPRLHRIG